MSVCIVDQSPPPPLRSGLGERAGDPPPVRLRRAGRERRRRPGPDRQRPRRRVPRLPRRVQRHLRVAAERQPRHRFRAVACLVHGHWYCELLDFLFFFFNDFLKSVFFWGGGGGC